MDVTFKLTSHARRRMKNRFNPPLRPGDIAEVIWRGKAYPFRGGYYLEHRNIGVVLKARMMSSFDFHVVTVIDLTRNKPPRMPRLRC